MKYIAKCNVQAMSFWLVI